MHHSPPIQIFPPLPPFPFAIPHSSRMEIHFQSHQEQEPEPEIPIQTTFRSRATKKNKYVGVRQRPSGKWVAEIKNTTQKIRMWLGTFDTPEEAARAYDEAACLLRGSNTRTNFVNHGSPPNSPLSLKIRNLFNQKKTTKKGGGGGLSFKPTQKTIQTSGETCSNGVKQDAQIFDGAYKPELRNFSGGMEVGWSCQSDQALAEEFDGLPAIPGGVEAEIPEFERMKFERQISASLYAMNGVNEYWENFQDFSGDEFWDFPPMACQLFCSG